MTLIKYILFKHHGQSKTNTTKNGESHEIKSSNSNKAKGFKYIYNRMQTSHRGTLTSKTTQSKSAHHFQAWMRLNKAIACKIFSCTNKLISHKLKLMIKKHHLRKWIEDNQSSRIFRKESLII